MPPSGMNWLAKVRRACESLRKRDFSILIVSLVFAGGALLFLLLAGTVTQGDPHALDAQILLALRSPEDPSTPIGPAWFVEAVRDLTALGSMLVLLLLSAVVIGFLLLRRQLHAAALLLVALVGALFWIAFFKDFFGRPRPEVVTHLHRVTSPSFPSGHSLLSAVIYLTLGSLLARFVAELRLKIYILSVALVLVLLIGLSRVYLGVHYPSDVLAGWILGLLWALICWLAGRALQKRGAVEKPR